MAIPAMVLLQQHDQHDARQDIVIDQVACSNRRSGAFRNGGIRNWGCNRAVKTNRLVYYVSQTNGQFFHSSADEFSSHANS